MVSKLKSKLKKKKAHMQDFPLPESASTKNTDPRLSNHCDMTVHLFSSSFPYQQSFLNSKIDGSTLIFSSFHFYLFGIIKCLKNAPSNNLNFWKSKTEYIFFQNCIKITLRILSSIFNVRTAYLNGLSSSKAFFMVITRSDLANSPNYIH